MGDIGFEQYAVSVIRIDDEHRYKCEKASGASGTTELCERIRWPGYVGHAYTNARVRLLCCAQVHHGPELWRTSKSIQSTLLQIASSDLTPQLLRDLSHAYERTIPKWGPWTDFKKILTPLGLDETNIAYTNIAKCWQTPGRSNVEKPMKECLKTFPLTQLAKTIDAQAIVLMSSTGTMNRVGIVQEDIPF